MAAYIVYLDSNDASDFIDTLKRLSKATQTNLIPPPTTDETDETEEVPRDPRVLAAMDIFATDHDTVDTHASINVHYKPIYIHIYKYVVCHTIFFEIGRFCRYLATYS
jgi:hypothetical protein